MPRNYKLDIDTMNPIYYIIMPMVFICAYFIFYSGDVFLGKVEFGEVDITLVAIIGFFIIIIAMAVVVLLARREGIK